jgi:hypothetical protein
LFLRLVPSLLFLEVSWVSIIRIRGWAATYTFHIM